MDYLQAIVGLATLYFTWKMFMIAKRESSNELPSRRKMLARYWPVLLCLLLSGSVWIPSITRRDDFPEWPEQKLSYVVSYGQQVGPNGFCTVVVNGARFLKYAGGYRIAGACFAYTGVGDVLDAPQIQVSSLYDIRNSSFPMVTPWGASFMKYLDQIHAGALNHLVLLVPRGIDPGSFATFRQARSMGVIIVPAGAAVSGAASVSVN